MARTNCVYCGRELSKRSKEHIIQNAIGGLYESEDICCPECNEYISKHIDAPFTKSFNPIISMIDNLAKTNNVHSQPSYTGKAIYDNEVYSVTIKKGKVVACPELSRKTKSDITKCDFKIISYDIPIENTSFKNGIGKIAFNFAVDKGIDLTVLKKKIDLNINNDKIDILSFNYELIPFVALNPMDEYLELQTEMELYHNMILFSQGKNLWCYIDLFNTFQYYVCLSDEWDENIFVHESYMQLLQKIDRTVPELFIRKPKHILTYAMFYHVDPCTDLDEFRKRVKDAIQKESLKKDMTDVVSAKLGADYVNVNQIKSMDKQKQLIYLYSLQLYFDEDDHLKDEMFRKVTLYNNEMDIVSYPLFIKSLILQGYIEVRNYTYKKFERLNQFLCLINNVSNKDN